MRRLKLRAKLKHPLLVTSQDVSVENLPACHNARICLLSEIRHLCVTSNGASSRCRQWIPIITKCAEDLTKDLWSERNLHTSSRSLPPPPPNKKPESKSSDKKSLAHQQQQCYIFNQLDRSSKLVSQLFDEAVTFRRPSRARSLRSLLGHRIVSQWMDQLQLPQPPTLIESKRGSSVPFAPAAEPSDQQMHLEHMILQTWATGGTVISLLSQTSAADWIESLQVHDCLRRMVKLVTQSIGTNPADRRSFFAQQLRALVFVILRSSFYQLTDAVVYVHRVVADPDFWWLLRDSITDVVLGLDAVGGLHRASEGCATKAILAEHLAVVLDQVTSLIPEGKLSQEQSQAVVASLMVLLNQDLDVDSTAMVLVCNSLDVWSEPNRKLSPAVPAQLVEQGMHKRLVQLLQQSHTGSEVDNYILGVLSNLVADEDDHLTAACLGDTGMLSELKRRLLLPAAARKKSKSKNKRQKTVAKTLGRTRSLILFILSNIAADSEEHGDMLLADKELLGAVSALPGLPNDLDFVYMVRSFLSTPRGRDGAGAGGTTTHDSKFWQDRLLKLHSHIPNLITAMSKALDSPNAEIAYAAAQNLKICFEIFELQK